MIVQASPIVSLPAPTPFIKWAGGKGQLLPQIRDFLPEHFGTYFEPFLGGGALFFYLQPARAVLGDSNAELINAYRIVRDQPDQLMTTLERHEYRQEHYYRVRSLSPDDLSDVERAARFIYLNKTCYNGLYRVNRSGQFNVPFGKFSSPPRLYDHANIAAASNALRHAQLTATAFDRTLEKAGRGDFVYLDPPYVPLTESSSFTSYTSDRFLLQDQQWLKAQFLRLTERGCKVLLSNSDTPLTRWLYAEFEPRTVNAARSINSDKSGRQAINELVVFNYPVPGLDQ